jgi:pimeloyl-ACP methyl ester carboxylesterase
MLGERYRTKAPSDYVSRRAYLAAKGFQAPTNSNVETEVRVDDAFLDAEARIFASYSLEPRSCDLRLTKPAILVRAVEVGGEPALFLHGFSLCAAHWTPLFARLPSLRRIAIDMPGHGASDGVDYRECESAQLNVIRRC